MKKGESIAEFMLKEHGEIFILLNDFKKNSSKDNAEDYFKNLKDKLEPHVFAEEKAIIILNEEGKKFKEIVTILQQHDEIEKLMKNIQENLSRKLGHYEENVKKVMELLKVHVALENKKFYPKLDKELNLEQKQIVLEKLRDVILGNIHVWKEFSKYLISCFLLYFYESGEKRRFDRS